MLAIMPISEAKKKMEAMLFKLHYPETVRELESGTLSKDQLCSIMLKIRTIDIPDILYFMG